MGFIDVGKYETKDDVIIDIEDGYRVELVTSTWRTDFDDVRKHLKTGIKHIYGLYIDSEAVVFHCKDDYIVVMYHEQDCCEYVYLESCDSVTNKIDIYTDCDWCDIEEVSSDGCGPKNDIGYAEDESFTWTFYKLTTNKGYDTIRWYGASNGYYSERVDFCIYKIIKNDK